MKKELRQLRDGMMQVTIVDERWYARPRLNETTGVPDGYDFVPSVTWIASHYPKGIGFMKWLASTGWDEARAIREAAGDRGSKVHQAISLLVEGQTVEMDQKIMNPSTGQPEELTLEEYECLLAFRDWWAEARPTLIAQEFVLWGDGYAGTGDLLCEQQGAVWLLDIKTSQQVWPEHELQVSAYRHALSEQFARAPIKLGILQVGYKRNKKGWKLTEVADQYPLFLAAKEIWKKETKGIEVFQRDYPLRLSLGLPTGDST